MMIACVTIMHGLKTVLNHQARESISFMLCLDLGFVTQFVEGNEKVREMQLAASVLGGKSKIQTKPCGPCNCGTTKNHHDA